MTAASPGQTDRVAAIVKRNNAAAKPVTDVVDAAITEQPPYQVMPPLEPEDYAALRESIWARGVLVPIIVDETGIIIDGQHRAKIAAELGVECPRGMRTGLTDADKRSLAYTLNLARRQLTRAQVRKLTATSLKADPQLSDREHARRTGVSPTTVGTVRGKLEQTGDVSKLDTRTDSAGREQPASKPPVASPELKPTAVNVAEQRGRHPEPVNKEPEPIAEPVDVDVMPQPESIAQDAPKKARLLTRDEKLRRRAQVLAGDMDTLTAEVEALFTEALDAGMADEVEALFDGPFGRPRGVMYGTRPTTTTEEDNE